MLLNIVIFGRNGMDTAEQSTGWDYLDWLFEMSTETMGAALEFRIFDTQYCDHIQEDWLASAVKTSGITRVELDWMIGEGLLRRWKSPSGKEGFLLYSERQAVIAKQLRNSGRYSIEELRHIFSDWNNYLEIVMTDELAYDSFDVNDYEHFRRRSAEMVQFFEEDLNRTDHEKFPLTPEQIAFRKEEAVDRLRMWKWIHNKVAKCLDNELAPKIQKAWRKLLFHLRWTFSKRVIF